MAVNERSLSVIEAQAPHVTEYVPAVSVTIEQAKANFERLHQVTRELMKKGVDFDQIPGTPKPTLLKPGAEHLLQFFGLGHKVQRVQALEDWEKGFFYYCYRVTVFKARPMPDGTVYEQVVAECEGSANSKEKRYRNQDVFTIVNTLQKMAIKRALVGATLQATGTSGMFTQDVEDLEDVNGDAPRPANVRPSAAPRAPRADAKAVFGYVREWASSVGIDPQEAEAKARELLQQAYKVDTCAKLTPAQWQSLWDGREKLVSRLADMFAAEATEGPATDGGQQAAMAM